MGRKSKRKEGKQHREKAMKHEEAWCFSSKNTQKRQQKENVE